MLLDSTGYRSMEPTIKTGSLCLGQRLPYVIGSPPPHRGEIAIYRSSTTGVCYVKRVIGLRGIRSVLRMGIHILMERSWKRVTCQKQYVHMQSVTGSIQSSMAVSMQWATTESTQWTLGQVFAIYSDRQYPSKIADMMGESCQSDQRHNQQQECEKVIHFFGSGCKIVVTV